MLAMPVRHARELLLIRSVPAAAASLWFVVCLIVFAATVLSGCKSFELPPGAQAQASSVGIDVAPQGPVGPHVTFGSKAITITTAQPENAPNLNRLSVEAPGIQVRSTVATGPVGEEIQKAGGLGAIERFSGDTSSTAPRTDLGQPATDD